MKKILFLLFALVTCNLIVMADGYNSCRVYGAKNSNVATLLRSTATAFENGGSIKIDIFPELTKPADEDTAIVVNIKDGRKVVATAVVRISKGRTSPTNGYETFTRNNLTKGTTYNLEIASASCQ